MSEQVKPKQAAIEEQIAILLSKSVFTGREEIARSIFLRWRQATRAGWVHGIGLKSNVRSPDPDQRSCLASWRGYMTGDRPQNLDGWNMVAEVLQVGVWDIVEIDGPLISNDQRVWPNMPGDFPLSRLGSLQVSDPDPGNRANAVHDDTDRPQAIKLTVRPTFGTVRNEDFYDSDGKYLATADLEASYVYLLVETKDRYMKVLGGIGVEGGEVSIGGITCRYESEQDGRVRFELRAAGNRPTLAGLSQTLDDLVELDGTFCVSDWIGIGLDKGSLQIVKADFPSSTDNNSASEHSLRNQIKRQILLRGIELQTGDASNHDVSLSARRFFMRRILDEGGK